MLRESAPRRDEDKGEADDDDLIGEAEVELPGGGEVGGEELLGKEEWQVRASCHASWRLGWPVHVTWKAHDIHIYIT
eukprot:COSAG01_NODE_1404_length_10443_cov_29.217517_7_plen_77_part_00